MKTNNFTDSILVACFIFCGVYAIISINPFKTETVKEKYSQQKEQVTEPNEKSAINGANETESISTIEINENQNTTNNEDPELEREQEMIANINNSLDSYQNSYNTINSAYSDAYNNHLSGKERYVGEYRNARNSTEKLCEEAMAELRSIGISHRDLLTKNRDIDSRLSELFEKFQNLEATVFAN